MEKSKNEERIRAITKIYYSNPKIQEILLKFSQNREVVPRYFEGFGKRPDTLQYTSDILGLVNKGATSFHASEEIWNNPLEINSDMSPGELNEKRKSWDLLIDIDSPFLDFSKIAAKLLLDELEIHGVKNYSIKFSGSKGFHIIISGKAFPQEYQGKLMKDSFPEWPRAICEYLMHKIKSEFSKKTRGIANINALELRTQKKREELVERVCPQCGKPVQEDVWVTLKCDYCSNEVRLKKTVIARKRILRCGNCSSVMNIANEEKFLECKDCNISNISKFKEDSKNVKYTKDARSETVVEMSEGLQEKEIGGFDLVLVAPRHLFRMPYSLHEKTSLASVVLTKEEIESFNPRDASPLNIKIREYLPDNEENEARKLLAEALEWKKKKDQDEERNISEKYKNIEFKGFDFSKAKVEESMFPITIRKLLKGLKDGKKRGLFILITFYRSLGFNAEYINNKVREWNKLNEPPLKEGYIKSQVDWHLKQKRKILPPNYDNESFYKDLGLLDGKPKEKNPIVEVMRKIRT